MAHSPNHPPTYQENYKQAQLLSGLPQSQDNRELIIAAFVTGLILTGASMFQNALFALSIAGDGIAAMAVMLALYLGFDAFKIAAPAFIRAFWVAGSPFTAAFIGTALVLVVVAALVSGNGFMSTAVEETETSRVEQSPEYISNQQEQERLQAEIASIAVAPAVVVRANAELERLRGQWEKAYAKNSAYMTRGYVPKGRWYKRTAQAVRDDMKPLDDAIAVQQRIITKSDIYQGKIAELERLQAAVPSIKTGGGEIAGFINLAAWFDAPAVMVKVQVLVWTTIASEICAACCWLSFVRLRGQREFTASELAQAQYQIYAQTMLIQHAMAETSPVLQSSPKSEGIESPVSVVQEGSDAEVLTEKVVTEAEVLLIPEDGKRSVGGIYPCEHCSTPFTARTVWHKFCPDCRTEKDRAAMTGDTA